MDLVLELNDGGSKVIFDIYTQIAKGPNLFAIDSWFEPDPEMNMASFGDIKILSYREPSLWVGNIDFTWKVIVNGTEQTLDEYEFARVCQDLCDQDGRDFDAIVLEKFNILCK